MDKSSILWVFGLAGIAVYSLFSQAFIGGVYWIGWFQIIFQPGTLPANPIFWRAFGVFAGHHSVIMFMVVAEFVLLWKYLGLTPLVAVAAVWMAIAWHETEWWVVDIVKMLQTSTYFNPFWFFGWLSMAAAIMFSLYPHFVNWPKRYMAAMTIFYVGWFAIGFPITVNFPGPTSLYSDATTGAIEILSWMWALASFWILERKILLSWQTEIFSLLKTVINKEAGSPAMKNANAFLQHKRKGAGVLQVVVVVILWATVGILALQILSTASTTGFSTIVATLAVTVVAIFATISVALGMMPKGHGL